MPISLFKNEENRMSEAKIAVIGLDCVFPGAENCNKFWQNLVNGVNSIRKVDNTRWASEDDEYIGMVDGYDNFDHRFFHISPNEAELIDPQQRMMIQSVYRCIEDSGIPMSELQNKRTAVYISYWTSDYRNILLRSDKKPSSSMLVGNCDSSVANRISYMFDLYGESLSVNAACAGGLVAVHHARRALLDGECDYAIVGGVNLNLDVWKYRCLKEGHMLSPEGQCKAFSIDANGYVPSDGVAAFLMCKEELAAENKADCYGFICGSSTNHTGQSYSITAPRIERQADAISSAIRSAGISAEQIKYVEAHGTGTSLGDPIETEGLKAAFAEFTTRRHFCYLGSVKANIGHTESAAGLAGLAKVLMIANHKMIPQEINIKKQNPIIDLEDSPFTIAENTVFLNEEETFYAGISSFGISGSNGHIIVSEAVSASVPLENSQAKELFVLSANSRSSLEKMCRNWRSFADTSQFRRYGLADMCRLMQSGRKNGKYRIAFCVSDKDELKNKLNSALESEISSGSARSLRAAPVLPSYTGYDDVQLFFEYIEEASAELERVAESLGDKFDLMYQIRLHTWNTEYKPFLCYICGFIASKLLTKAGFIFVPTFPVGMEYHTLFHSVDGWVAPAQVLDYYLHNAPKPEYHTVNNILDATRLEQLFTQIKSEFGQLSGQDKESVEKLLSLACELYPYQFTLKKIVDQWTEMLSEASGYAFLTERRNEEQSRNLLRFVVCADAILSTYKKWNIRYDLHFVSVDLERLLIMVTEKLLTKRQFIDVIVNGSIRSKIKVPEKVLAVFLPCMIEGMSEVAGSETDVYDIYTEDTLLDSFLLAMKQLYLSGADVDWSALYPISSYRKYHLPVYEFEKISHLVQHNDSFVALTQNVLESHIISDENIVPAAYYIAELTTQLPIGCALKNISFLKKLAVNELEHVYMKEKNGNTKFAFYNGSGQVLALAEKTEGDMSDACEDAHYEANWSALEFYDVLRGFGYAYGDALRHVVNIKTSAYSAQAVLSQKRYSAFDNITAVIDNALQTMIFCGVKSNVFQGLVLPYHINYLKLTDRFANVSHMRVVRHDNRLFDCTFYCADNSVAGIMKGVQFHVLSNKKTELYGFASVFSGEPENGSFPNVIYCSGIQAGTLSCSCEQHDLNHFFYCTDLPEKLCFVFDTASGSMNEQLLTIARIVRYAGENVQQTVRMIFCFVGENIADASVYGAALASADMEYSKLKIQVRYYLASQFERSEHFPPVFGDEKSFDEIGYIDNSRIRRVLTKISSGTQARLKRGGTYLITGAAGELGRKLARFLTENYAADLILTGRKIPENTQVFIAKCTAAGGSAVWYQADVTSETDISLLEHKLIDRKLDGIFHCAGNIEDAVLRKKTDSSIERVLAPKCKGVELVHGLAEKLHSGFLMLFSSVVSVWGNYGQFDYAAANRYMDAFAWNKNTPELRVVSVNWPLFTDGGMKLQKEYEKLMESTYGISAITADEAFSLLNEVLSCNEAIVFPLKISETQKEGMFSKTMKKPTETIREQKKMNKKNELTKHKIITTMVQVASEILGLQTSEIDVLDSMSVYGFESVTVAQFCNRLNDILHISITPTAFFENDRFEDLADSIAADYVIVQEDVLEIFGIPEQNKKNNSVLEENAVPIMAKSTESASEKKHENAPDVVVIGIAARFPMAEDCDEFSQNLSSAKNCITDIPAERWNTKEYCEASPELRTSVTKAGLIQNAYMFDNEFWNISYKEACEIDPQQKIVLEQVLKAAEDAGHQIEELAEAGTGVFAAASTMDQAYLMARAQDRLSAKSMLSSYHCIISNRVSYIFNFTGPSETIDTACSGSLAALNRAVLALKNGECRYAFVIGVNMILAPDTMIAFDRSGMLSHSHASHAFDDSADGYARGEGAGVILLTLSSQIRDTDDPYCSVIGTAVCHCGHSKGLTVPDPERQADVIFRAWKDTGVSPDHISFIESHGTGTPLGDPIEISGLNKAFARLSAHYGVSVPAHSCSIGALKAAIGHLEAASGIASVIKLCIQMRQRKLFRICGFERINQYISLDNTPFRLLLSDSDWKGEKVYAGISAFGFGGTSAHAAFASYSSQVKKFTESETEMLFIYSAKDEETLMQVIRQEYRFISTKLNEGDIATYSYALKIHRQYYNYRIAFTAESREVLLKKLEEHLNGNNTAIIGTADNSMLRKFISPGSGDQLIREHLRNKDQEKIAYAWVNGLTIDWDSYYNGSAYRKMKLSQYPFHYKRCSFLDISAESQQESRILTGTVSIDYDSPLISQHIVCGFRVVPAAFYLNLLCNVCRGDGLTFTDIVFCRPLIAYGNSVSVSYRTEFYGERGTFAISDEKGNILCKGNLAKSSNFAADINDIDVSAEQFSVTESDKLISWFASVDICYGELYQRLSQIRSSADVSVQMISSQNSDREICAVTALDCAMQPALYMHHAEKCSVPFEIGSVQCFGSLELAVKSIVKRSEDEGNDVYILDNAENVICQIKGLKLQSSTSEDICLAVPDWKEIDVSGVNAGEELSLRTCVIGRRNNGLPVQWDHYEIESNISAAKLCSEYDRIIFSGIGNDIDFSNMQASVSRYASILRDIASVDHQRIHSVLLMSYPDGDAGAFNAELEGLFLSVSREMTNVFIGVFRCEDTAEQSYVLMRKAETLAPNGRCLFRIAGNRLFIQHYSRCYSECSSTLPNITDSVIVIAGNGGIARLVAQYLITKHRAKVVLLGRRSAEVAGMTDSQAGYYTCDITDADSLRKTFEAIICEYGEVNTVIHSAMVLKDSTIVNMTDEMFRDVTAPKVFGIKNLGDCCEQFGVSRLIVFSSAQSCLNYAGQCSYSAASTFIDAYAEKLYRNSSYRVQVINWGLWGDVGAVSDSYHQKKMKKSGLLPLSAFEGMKALEMCLSLNVGAVAALRSGIGADVLNTFSVGSISSGQKQERSEHTDGIAGFLEDAAAGYDMIGRVLVVKAEMERIGALFIHRHLEQMTDAAIRKVEAHRPELYHELVKIAQAHVVDTVLCSAEEICKYQKVLDLLDSKYIDMLTGECDPVSILFSSKNKGLLADIYQNNVVSDYYNEIVKMAVQYLLLKKIRQYPERKICILEIGAGTAGTTDCVIAGIRKLSQYFTYCFTDVSLAFINNAREKYKDYDCFVYQTADISSTEVVDRLGKGYDIIIAANVIHAVPDIDLAVRNMRSLLREDGVLILNELTAKNAFYTAVFGLLDGWWLNSGDSRRISGSPLLTCEAWNELLTENGFANVFQNGDIVHGRKAGQNVIIADAAEITFVGNDNEVRSVIIDALEKCLGEKIKKTDISFGDLGIDSILAIEFVDRVNKSLHTKFRATDVFNYVSPEGMIRQAEQIR